MIHPAAKLLLISLVAYSVSSAGQAIEPAIATNSLVGSYAMHDHKSGALRPFLKVDHCAQCTSGYSILEYGKSGWRPIGAGLFGNPPGEVRFFSAADLEKQVHHKVDVPVSGLQANQIAVVHVPRNWSDSDGRHAFTTQSGYFALTVLGPIELVPMTFE